MKEDRFLLLSEFAPISQGEESSCWLLRWKNYFWFDRGSQTQVLNSYTYTSARLLATETCEDKNSQIWRYPRVGLLLDRREFCREKTTANHNVRPAEENVPAAK